ncbi:MAG: iron-sulfur cluster assembly accessory protein [Rickettsiales bacterium]|jgi:iron-sulfur cluster assembly accessory protein|nr:iron-sulfur cluster assembly accessory protein [Rickettsiales bacterium]
MTVTLTENATTRIAHLASKQEKPGAMLRITVEGGGCSGFQYRYDFPVWEKASDDTAFTHNGVTLLIDAISLKFMEGTTLDFVETLGSAIFEIRNPKSKANCGCGNSFAV